MPRIEPGLIPVVNDLERGLRELGVRFGLVGALVPELLLAVRPPRRTNDVDVVAVVATIPDFEAVKERLGAYGFSRTSAPYQLKHRDGGRVDVLPVGQNVAPGGRLNLGDGFDLNMAGFDQVVPNAIEIPIEGGPTLPVAPLPLYVLLKLVAFTDRKAPKDLGSVLHCLEHYLEDDDRRYGVDHDGAGVPYDYTCAYLLGGDGRPFLDEPVRRAVTAILNRFDEPDAEVYRASTEIGTLTCSPWSSWCWCCCRSLHLDIDASDTRATDSGTPSSMPHLVRVERRPCDTLNPDSGRLLRKSCACRETHQ